MTRKHSRKNNNPLGRFGGMIGSNLPPAPYKPKVVSGISAPVCEPVTLLARTSHQCGWPLGATDGPNTIMCGAAKRAGPPYCGYHARMALA